MANEPDTAPVAPARTLTAGPAIPSQSDGGQGDKSSFTSRFRRPADQAPASGTPSAPATSGAAAGAPAGSGAGSGPGGPRQVRQAKLRLVQVEPWSVMKAAFVLSVAIGIVTVVAVAIVWGVLGAAGLWDSVNSIVQDSIGDSKGAPFEIQKYLGTSRILGFTMLVAVADVILITAIATLAAFLYNLAATLVGGVEVTFAEDK